MKRRSLEYWRCLLLLLAAITPVACFGPSGHAQENPTDSKLATQVHLHLGSTTLGQVAATLSQQTGLAIRVASYLQEHRLIVQMDNLSARDALEALSTLNEWIWYRTEPGHYMITRPRVRLPRDIAGISSSLYGALPKEIRRYVGIGVPLDELSPISDPQMQEELTATKQQGIYEVMATQMSVSAKMAPLLARQYSLLTEALKPNIFDGRVIPYDKLSGEQKQALLTAFVLKALETVTMQPRSYVFSGKFLPSLNAIRNMDISMPSANWLEVGILVAERQGQRRIGFGGEILPPSDILPSTPTFR